MSGRLLIRRERAARSIPQLPERVSGWPLQVERLARGSRLKISVESGFARLIWPERVSATDALAFFEQHREWLEQTVRVHRQAVDRAAADLALDPRWPGRVPWFGRLLPIHFEHGPARLDIDTQAIRCRVPKGEVAAAKAAQRLIIAGLVDALAMRARVWLREYEPLVGARCQALRIRPMRSLWGSLSPQGAIALNLALAFADESLAEYVVVHELAHFVARDHSPRFWAVVAKLYPDYPQRRQELNREHRYLQALLRRLYAPVGSDDSSAA
ncbi:MAG: M48 family metallopeptidase [Lysobacterales bacterium]